MWWLDNQHLLFSGYTVNPGERFTSEFIKGKPGIFILNASDLSHVRHADLQPAPWFICYNRGFIAYSTDGGPQGDAQRIIMAGPLGEEKQLLTDVFWAKNPELKQCHENYPKIDDSPQQTAYAVALLPGDGTIEVSPNKEPGYRFDPKNQNSPVVLKRPGQVPIVLPILAKEMYYQGKVTYSEFAGKYVLIPDTWPGHEVTKNEAWPDNEPRRVYLISREGKVETFKAPLEARMLSIALPTRQGLFIGSNDHPDGAYSLAGGWVLFAGGWKKIYSYISQATVSPDGCKLVYQNGASQRDLVPTLKVLNLCPQTTK